MRLASSLLVLSLVVGCNGSDRPPLLSDDGSGVAGGSGDLSVDDDGGSGGCQAPPVANPACGGETVAVLQQKPNIYFVLDTSGSMSEPITVGGKTKLEAARQSLLQVARELGHRINYGLASFPGPDGDALYAGCGTGEEIFATREGDPITCVGQPALGPVYSAFANAVSRIDATGGTPLAASLVNVTDKLEALPGTTAVILLTDGAPNCNADEICDVHDCLLNRQSAMMNNGYQCIEDDPVNCCDPDNDSQTGLFPELALSYCIASDAAVAAVTALADAGIKTYVIGVPGVEAFADVMNQLAEAGGTARDGDLAYYDASDTNALTDTLRTIGATISQSCELELKKAPADANYFNVYFDAVPVPRDSTDGWTLSSKTVTLHGAACEQLESGGVSEIQMIAGCVTVTR